MSNTKNSFNEETKKVSVSNEISIIDEIAISCRRDFYGEDPLKREEALRLSIESWYKRSKSDREGALRLAKELNALNENPLTEEQKEKFSERAFAEIEKHGFMPIEKIKISVINGNEDEKN